MGADDAAEPAAASAAPGVVDAGRYDLTAKLGLCLDRHLVFPLLEFLQVRTSARRAVRPLPPSS
jgi:hypothetical protein